MQKAANDELRPLWPAEAQVYVRQAISALKMIEDVLVKQDHRLSQVPASLNSSIQRIRRAIRVVNKGLQ